MKISGKAGIYVSVKEKGTAAYWFNGYSNY